MASPKKLATFSNTVIDWWENERKAKERAEDLKESLMVVDTIIDGWEKQKNSKKTMPNIVL